MIDNTLMKETAPNVYGELELLKDVELHRLPDGYDKDPYRRQIQEHLISMDMLEIKAMAQYASPDTLGNMSKELIQLASECDEEFEKTDLLDKAWKLGLSYSFATNGQRIRII